MSNSIFNINFKFGNINIFKNIKDSNVSNTINQNDKKIKKVLIDDLNKVDFCLEDINLEKYFPRYLISEKSDTNFSFEENQKLKDSIQNDKKIVLLGNAGIGKTKELQNLFTVLWEEKQKTNLVPSYLNIKNFRKTSIFEDLIKYKDWKLLPKLIFIIDGLDEIADIQDFVSSFENFISENKNRDIRYVISCRTNIYDKYVIKLDGFEKYYLPVLNSNQIANYLKDNYSFEVDCNDYILFQSVLENPFSLKLFGEFYINKKRRPNSLAEIYEFTIKKNIDTLFIEKFKEGKYLEKVVLVSDYIEKVAVTNELLQQNLIYEKYLVKIIKDEKYFKAFKKLPFIDKNSSQENAFFDYYSFIHKNYQEYFAANYLKEKSTVKIINFIKIDEITNKVKPSLLNTISFLLNIIDDTKRNEVVNWLNENDYEYLFTLEPEKLEEEFRKEIFKKYFNQTIIEEKKWFNSHRNYLKNLIQFIDLDFLIEQFKLHQSNHRIRYSITSFLDTYRVKKNEEKKLKTFIDECIENSTFSKTSFDYLYIEDLLYSILRNKFYEDRTYFNGVYNKLKNTTFRSINSAFIQIFIHLANIDDYFELFYDELHYQLKIKNRIYDDGVSSGLSFYKEFILSKLNKENFLKCVELYIQNDKNFFLNDFYPQKQKQEVIDKFVKFYDEDDSILNRIIDAAFQNIDVFYNRSSLDILIEKTHSEGQAFEYIFSKNKFKTETYYLLLRLIQKENVSFLIDNYKNIEITEDELKEITGVRNQLYYNFENKKEIGILIDEEFRKIGFEFKEKIKTKEEIEEINNDYNNFRKQNIELLYDKKELLKKIKKVFEDNNLTEISHNKNYELNRVFNTETNYFYGSTIPKECIDVLIKDFIDYNSLSYQKAEEIINNDTNYFHVCVELLKNYRISNNFKLEESFIQKLKNLAKQTETEILDFGFDKIFTIEEDFSARIEDVIFRNKIDSLHYFEDVYNFELTQSYYLKALEYSNFICHDSQINNYTSTFEKFIDKITNKKDFQKIIIEKLNSKLIFKASIYNFLEYALKNNFLLEIENDVVEFYILQTKITEINNLILPNYCKILSENQSLEFLKKCCSDSTSRFCWKAMDVLKERFPKDDFLVKVANDYLELKEKNLKFYPKALDVLFFTNQNYAIEKFCNFVKENIYSIDDYYHYSAFVDLQNYNHKNEIPHIFDLIKFIFSKEDLKNSFGINNIKQIISIILSKFSENDAEFELIQEQLNDIKKDISNENNLFWITQLIDTTKKSNLDKKNKPKSFDEIILLLN